MFTVCPKCTLTLAVTAADLRAGQGYVRCGRCTNVFNALLTLSEQSPGTAAMPPHAAPAPAPARTDTSASADDDASDGSPIESQSSIQEGTGTFETIVLEGDTISQTEEFVPEAAIDQELAALNQRFDFSHRWQDSEPTDTQNFDIDVDVDTDADADADTDTDDGGGADTQATVSADDAVLADELLAGIAVQRHPRRRWPWIAGSVVCVLLLVAQIVNHWRDALAADPHWNRPLTRLYGGLGIRLMPRWDLNAYDVRQQGAETDPAHAGAIRVRLSLANRAPRAQPLPVLRLTLLDRYGKRIAARDLRPAEYLPPAAGTLAFLAPDQRLDTQISVQDPGSGSASFELDVCLDDATGALRCAGDQP